ncbi:MAG: lasso peptide biosynthesis B2 protein [Acidobacteria bacterium]|nr:lasso peptide biosynthesis B2 protein [Acidobacteriota bacterium]
MPRPALIGHALAPPSLTRGKSAGAGSAAALKKARRTAWLVNAAGGQPGFRFNCLQRSLCLWFLLERCGIDCSIWIGSRRILDKFEAHAWVEFEGAVLNDSQDISGILSPSIGRSRFNLFFSK